MSARYAALTAGFLLLVSGVLFFLAPADASAPYPFGDANCDSAVDQADGLVVLRAVAGVPGEDGCSAPQSVESTLDVDCDEVLTAQDALLLFLFAAGLPADNGPECEDIGSGTPTGTPPVSETPTETPSVTPTPSGSATPTATPTPTPTPTGTSSPSPSPSPTPSPTPTPPAYALTEIVPVITGQRGLGLYPIPGQPDAAILLTQAGIMYRVSLSGAFSPTVWGNLTDRIITSSTEEGLLGLAFALDYPSDPRVYVYYNRPPASAGFRYREVLSRFDVEGDLDEASEEVLISLDDRGYYHNGGQIAFGADGYLYLSIGDEGFLDQPAPSPDMWLWDNAQDLTTLFGKVIRIDVSGDTGYTIPAGNPFADGPGGYRDEIWARGFRNPWRFSFDPATGDMWLGDVGYARNEEVNIIEPGQNYGWPYREGPIAGPVACNTPCDPNDFTEPVASYCQRASCDTEDCAVVAGFVYHGGEMPELEGWYIFADWCSGVIRALDPANPDQFRVLYDAVAPWSWLSSLALLPDGEIAVVMRDDYDGSANTRVFRLGHAP